MKNIRFLPLIILSIIGKPALAQPQVGLTLFASGLSSPVDIKHCGDDRLFVIEKTGYIQILDITGSKNPQPFLDIHTVVGSAGSEQGLLGMAFSPNYSVDGFFYLNYTDINGNTHISRFSRDLSNPDLALASSEELLLTVTQPYSNHNGGMVQFGLDGYLYIGLGDGGNAGDPGNRAQAKKEYLGKLLRIDVSNAPGYTIPANNPFVGDSSYYPEIYALGIRNPWRFSFDKINGDLWIGDVGQNTWEEIDHHPASAPGGMNYGWRCYEGNVAYNNAGCNIASYYEPPVFTYQHSGTNGCSITGGYVYRGAQYAELFGKYLYTDFCSGNLWALDNSNGTYVNTLLGNFADNQYGSFGEDQYGELYLAELYSGKIYKIEETSCLPTAFIAENDSIVQCGSSVNLQTPPGPGLSYIWKLNGTNIPGATLATYSATQNGTYSVRVTNASNCHNLSDPVIVIINNNPVVNINGLLPVYCINNTSVILNGSPTGGVFGGSFVTGNIFNPSQAGLGTHSINYTFTDANGCIGKKWKTITVDGCALVSEYGIHSSPIISPNPSEGIFNVQLPDPMKGEMNISITDLVGQKIYNKSNFVPSQKTISIDMTGLNKGIYLLKLTADGKQSIQKFIIQ